ncbi:histidine kinase-like protein [Lentzea flaviverrucosa]|uniref:Histidine kinase-like ATPase domain-containing protein n=2 Tax=Lentzea flaviverrucosa TaxID=200379 RepID=A0A1H9XW70_9PSEU|nr:histidine kinase-like protein [Lentzea flaviverrucosa]SES50432.1 Histidine kinase-like ATPase domain-containing protein [Lentzea flaviverrucosa]
MCGGFVSSAGRPGGTPRTCSVDLDDHVGNVAGVRHLTRDVLRHISNDDLEDVLLVVTELVSNAFDHGEAPRLMRLTVTPRPYVVRCEVDDAAERLPVLGRSRSGGFRGRGMVLVDELATAWGVVPGNDFKTVWAELKCEPR